MKSLSYISSYHACSSAGVMDGLFKFRCSINDCHKLLEGGSFSGVFSIEKCFFHIQLWLDLDARAVHDKQVTVDLSPVEWLSGRRVTTPFKLSERLTLFTVTTF